MNIKTERGRERERDRERKREKEREREREREKRKILKNSRHIISLSRHRFVDSYSQQLEIYNYGDHCSVLATS